MPKLAHPKNAAETRTRILQVARREFSRAGFSRTTVRSVAEAAGVSANLITRYFGGKEGLFFAAAAVSLEVGRVLDVPREAFGDRLAEQIVARWTSLQQNDPILVLHRAAGERGEAAAALSRFLDDESLEPVRRQLLRYGMEVEDAAFRAEAIDAFVVGVSTRLRVLRDNLGEASRLQRWMAVTIQRLIDVA